MKWILTLFLLLINITQAQEIGKPFVNEGHSGMITSITIAPNGKFFASGGIDIKIWDIKSGKFIKTLKYKVNLGGSPHSDMYSILSIAISSDSKRVVSGSNYDNIKIWDIKSGKLLKTLRGHKSSVESVAITPDGKRVVSGSYDKTIKIWDINSGKLLKTLRGHKYSVESVAITPDGKRVVSGSWDETIKIWDLNSGKLLKTLTGHEDGVNSVVITPDSKRVVSGSRDGTIKIWDLKSGKLLKTLRGHENSVESISITPDGKRVVSGSKDSTIKLWDINSGKLLKTLRGHENSVESIAITPDDKRVISGSNDDTIKIWDIKSDKVIETIKEYKNNISSIVITPSGKRVVSGSWDKTIKIWDIKSGKLLKTLRGHKSWVESVAITPDGKRVVSGNDGGTIKIWNINNSKLLKTLKEHEDRVNSVAITPDGKRVAFGSGDKTIKIWELKSGKLLKTLKGHRNSVESVAVTPDGKRVVSGSDTIKIWDINSGKLIKTLRGHKYLVNSVAITPDGKRVISGSWDKTIKIWDINSGKLIKTLREHKGLVSSISITPDGKVVSGSWDKTIKIWDINSGKLLKTLRGHKNWVESITITPNGKRVVSGSWDGAIKIWDINSGRLLLTLYGFDDGEWVAITPEGYFDASKGGAKYLNVLTSPMSVTSIDSFYEKFYRPDIVKLALRGKKVDTGFKISDVKPIPEVDIVGYKLSQDQKELNLKVKITDMGGGIGEIRVYRNGVAISLDSRAIPRSQNRSIIKTFNIPLEPGKNRIEVTAFNKEKTAQSSKTSVTVVANYKKSNRPIMYALIVGIKEFENSDLNLAYTVNDANTLAETLQKYSKGLYRDVRVTLLTTKEQTTKQNILKEFKKLQNIDTNDMVLIYFATHGLIDDGEYYLLSSNVGSTRTDKLKEDALTQDDIIKYISKIRASKRVVIFDSCNSGDIGKKLHIAMLNRGLSEDSAIKILSRATGTTIISASLSQQQAIEGYKEHGLFSYVLIDGLRGRADSNRDGFVNIAEILDYLDTEVSTLSKKVFGVKQYPYSSVGGTISMPVTKVK